MVTAGNVKPGLQYTEQEEESSIFNNQQQLVIKSNTLGKSVFSSYCLRVASRWFLSLLLCLMQWWLLLSPAATDVLANSLYSVLWSFFRCFIKLLLLKELFFNPPLGYLAEQSLQWALSLSSSLVNHLTAIIFVGKCKMT